MPTAARVAVLLSVPVAWGTYAPAVKAVYALPAPPPDTTVVDAAVEEKLAAVEEKLAALRTVPVQRLFERRALRTRRSLFAAWREAAAEEDDESLGLLALTASALAAAIVGALPI